MNLEIRGSVLPLPPPPLRLRRRLRRNDRRRGATTSCQTRRWRVHNNNSNSNTGLHRHNNTTISIKANTILPRCRIDLGENRILPTRPKRGCVPRRLLRFLRSISRRSRACRLCRCTHPNTDIYNAAARPSLSPPPSTAPPTDPKILYSYPTAVRTSRSRDRRRHNNNCRAQKRSRRRMPPLPPRRKANEAPNNPRRHHPATFAQRPKTFRRLTVRLVARARKPNQGIHLVYKSLNFTYWLFDFVGQRKTNDQRGARGNNKSTG